MPIRWNTFPIELKGGRNEILPSIQQGIKAPGSAIYLTNFEPSLRGGYRRINGYSKFDSSVVPSADSSTQLLGVGFLDGTVIVPREGKIYKSSGSGWTEIATGRTQTTKHRYATINLNGTRKIIGVDGVNYPYSYDGTTFTNITGTTDINGCTHVVEFKDHVFYSAGDLVTFSIPFDETGFSVGDGAGSFRMPNEVTGMIVFRERLFVFTETEIKVLDGDSVTDFRLTSVSESVGCVHRDTIQEVAGDVIFLAADGLRLLGATDRIQDFSNESASKNIQSLITDFEDNYTQFHSTIVREKSQYRIFGWNDNFPRSSTEGWLGTQFEAANPNSFEWSSLMGFKVWSVTSNVYQGDELVYFVGDTEYVYQMESGQSFDGIAIEAEYRTPYISMEDPTVRKTIYSIKTYLEAEGAVTGTVGLSFDQGSSARIQPTTIPFEESGGVKWGEFVWGDENWASGSVEGSVEVKTVGSCFSVSVQYSFTEDQRPFILDTIFLEYSQEDRK
jgi:hypothetical protein